MGTDMANLAAKRPAFSMQTSRGRLCIALLLACAIQILASARTQAQGLAEEPSAQPVPSTETTPAADDTPSADARPAAKALARAELPPPTEESAKALTARIEALEKLASGALPEPSLDSLLTVSLDDDSSMIERDKDARVEQRRLVVALNQAERLQNRSEAELQQMRDQMLALELERKVLALPIEVRERLVQESANQGAPTEVVQEPTKAVPTRPQNPSAPQKAASSQGAQPAASPPAPSLRCLRG